MSAPIHPDQAYNSAQVAALVFLHQDRAWFYRWKNRYGAAEGFPKPISRNGQPRWRGADLLAWMSRPRRGTAPVAFQGDSETVVDIRDKLAARSAALAQESRQRLSRQP